MRALAQLLTGAALLQIAFGCPQPGKEYQPIQHDSSVDLFKRGYPIKNRIQDVWKGAKITYCFDPAMDQMAKKTLRSIIPKAWGLWKDAGLKDSFKMEEGKASYCVEANRDSYLLVSYNNERRLETTPGFTAIPGRGGPETNLDPRDGFGAGTGVANIAHELGHAWGLLHEHQRTGLWTPHFGGTGQDNMFDFTCTNLADYDTVNAKRQQEGKDMEMPCRFETAAESLSFSAYNLLPDTKGLDRGSPGEVDWKSIMIYGSTAGGKLVNGQRLNTLIKASDGSTFGYNTVPSDGDIATMYWLYEHELEANKNQPVPLWKKANRFHGIFSRKNQDKSCS